MSNVAIQPGVPAGYAPGVEPRRRTLLEQALVDTFARRGAQVGILWIASLLFLAVFAPFLANSHPVLMKVNGSISSPLLQHLTPIDVVLPLVFLTAVYLLTARSVPLARRFALLVVCTGIVLPFAYWAFIVDNFGEWMTSRYRTGVLVGIGFGFLAWLLITVLPLIVIKPRAKEVGWLAVPLLLVCALLVIFPVRPPKLVVFSKYRDLEARGQMQWAVRTIVPFSASDRSRDIGDNSFKPPSPRHWLGSERDGADLLSRLIHASRVALSIGFIATGISATIGIVVGGIMGYFAGWVDILGMRGIEILEAVPTLMLLIACSAMFGANLYLMMVLIGLLSWTGDARYIRAEFLRLRKQDFVNAALACGLPLRSVLFKHMLPNGVTPVLVSSSFGVASAILLESVLSFLGLGLVDDPSWGQMLNQARSGGANFYWWIAVFPGLAIFLTVFSYNMIGEAMRDALDPKLRKRD